VPPGICFKVGRPSPAALRLARRPPTHSWLKFLRNGYGGSAHHTLRLLFSYHPQAWLGDDIIAKLRLASKRTQVQLGLHLGFQAQLGTQKKGRYGKVAGEDARPTEYFWLRVFRRTPAEEQPRLFHTSLFLLFPFSPYSPPSHSLTPRKVRRWASQGPQQRRASRCSWVA
jgi:hypothetical protein